MDSDPKETQGMIVFWPDILFIKNCLAHENAIFSENGDLDDIIVSNSTFKLILCKSVA